MLHPTHRLLLKRSRPNVSVLDVQASTTDLTTYTFSNVSLGDLGSTRSIAAALINTFPANRIGGQKAIAIVIHSEAAAVTWTVSSITLGGVVGTIAVDRGGGTNAIDTAIATWDASSLSDIANSDVVVTFSKAVTACAIGVLLIENLVLVPTSGLATASGTSKFGHNMRGTTSNLQNCINNVLSIGGSTCQVGGGTETPKWAPGQVGLDGAVAPMLLYVGNNAEIDFSAAWAYCPGNGLDSGSGGWPGFNISWSGGGFFDSVCCGII